MSLDSENGDAVAVPNLSEMEREVLRRGLLEWLGPAHGTEEIAVAMGFSDLEDLYQDSGRIRTLIASGEAMRPIDWARAILATEVVFASDLVGAGVDWSITTGFSEEETIRTLRSVQRKLAGTVHPVMGTELGTPPQFHGGASKSRPASASDEARDPAGWAVIQQVMAAEAAMPVSCGRRPRPTSSPAEYRAVQFTKW